MSLATWKKEFYPVTASAAAKYSWLRAIDHSLRKWTGLLPKNLKKHGAHINAWGDIEDDTNAELTIDENSCSLCAKADVRGSKNCARCPILINVGVKCTDAFREFMYTQDPKPMIKLLETTSALHLAAAKKKETTK